MFGHGQIEGFTEKYGMEYQRPRYDETPDPWLVERHEREIAPLLQRRWLFAESGNFLLYDFFLDSGSVDENVFAYSNRNGDERALVVYNNHYGETHGTIHISAAYADKGAGQLRQQRIREGLGLSDNSAAILAWRDSLTGLEYLRRAGDLAQHGLTFDLHAYQCHVYLDWRELYSTADQPWDRLCDQLKGRGVESLEDALAKLELQPVHDALRAQLAPDLVRIFADLAGHSDPVAAAVNKNGAQRREFFDAALARFEAFLRLAQKAYVRSIGSAAVQPVSPGLLRATFRDRLSAAMRVPAIESLSPAPWTAAARRVLPSPSPQLNTTALWGPVLGWCALELLAESIDVENPERIALDLFDRLRLREPFAEIFNALGFEGEEGWRIAARMKVVLLTEAGVGKPEEAPATVELGTEEPEETVKAPAATSLATENEPRSLSPTLWPALWSDSDVRWLTGVHEAEGHSYLVRELYEELLWWLQMPSLLRLAGEALPGASAVAAISRTVEESLAAAEAAGYRVDLLSGPLIAEAASEEVVSEADSAAKQTSVPNAAPEKTQGLEEHGIESQAKTKADPA